MSGGTPRPRGTVERSPCPGDFVRYDNVLRIERGRALRKTLPIGSAYRGTHPEQIGPIVRRTRSSLDSGREARGISHSLSPKCPGTKRRTSYLDRVASKIPILLIRHGLKHFDS